MDTLSVAVVAAIIAAGTCRDFTTKEITEMRTWHEKLKRFATLAIQGAFVSLSVVVFVGLILMLYDAAFGQHQGMEIERVRPRPKGVWKADTIELNELRIRGKNGNMARITTNGNYVGVWVGTNKEGAALVQGKNKAYVFVYRRGKWGQCSSVFFYIGDDGEPMLEVRRPRGKRIKMPFKDLHFSDGTRYGPTPDSPEAFPVPPTMPMPKDSLIPGSKEEPKTQSKRTDAKVAPPDEIDEILNLKPGAVSD